VDAAASLLRAAKVTSSSSSSSSPSEPQLARWAAQARSSFSKAFLHQISQAPLAPLSVPIEGLSFRDLHPPNVEHHGNHNVRPSAQVEAASGVAAMGLAFAGDDPKRAALARMLAGLVLNVSSDVTAVQVGGVIDTSQLGRSLISFGRPDAAFALLSNNGSTSFYHMAQSTGTLWAHPGGADGNKGRCSSHNHVMMGGSVGEAIWGIGGIQPAFVRAPVPDGTIGERHLLLAPVPWLPESPRGAAVWRTTAGIASTSWAARNRTSGDHWGVWVNVTVPVGGDVADVKIMVPQGVTHDAVCAWDCGMLDPVASFRSEWVSFDNGGGHRKIIAVAPPAGAGAAPETASSACTAVWRSGNAVGGTVGVASVAWSPQQPGTSLFPALTLTVGSGSYGFFAQAC